MSIFNFFKPPPPPNDDILKLLNLHPRQLLENLALIGQTGGGKTTLMHVIHTALLRYAVGMCFCTVKSDAPDDYLRTCYKAGRADVKLFRMGQSKFNPVSFILSRPWGSPLVLAEFIEEADSLQSRSSGGKNEAFWKTMRREAMIHAAGICQLAWGDQSAGGGISFDHIYKVLSSVPGSKEALKSFNEENYCWVTLNEANNNTTTQEHVRLVKAAYDFFGRAMPMSGGEVVGPTIGHLSGLIANFVRGKLYETTCGVSDHTPLWDLDGHITIFEDTVSQGVGNQFTQLIYARALTREALARKVTKDTPMCFLIRDEYSEICAPTGDAQAMTQGRSQRFGQQIAVQSYSTLLNSMDDKGVGAEHQAQTILGNCISKIFLSNTDPQTGKLFEELSGKTKRILTGGGVSQQAKPSDFDFLGVGGGFNMNYHEQYLPRQFGSALAHLKTGGPANNCQVSFYIHQSGTVFPNGLPYRKATVKQDFS